MIRYNNDQDLKKKNYKKKKSFTDGQTDGRTTQNYSSEPHNTKKKNFLRTDGQTDGQPKTIVRNLTIKPEKNKPSELKYMCTKKRPELKKKYRTTKKSIHMGIFLMWINFVSFLAPIFPF